MAIELEKPELRSFELRKKRHKQRVRTIMIIAIFIIVIIALFIFQQMMNRSYNSYEIIHTTQREDSSSANYISYKDGVIRYSRDGIMAMDSMGNRLWNGTYEMKAPIIDVSGDYVAVADNGRKLVQLYNGSKQQTIEVLSNILDVEVASQGVVAVLMESDQSNLITVYSFEGTELLNLKTSNTKNGFPVDMDLSADGKTLATSYMFLNNGVVQNKITFYSFSAVGDNYTDKIVGSYDYGSTIFPKVEFVNSNTLVAFGDGKVGIYQVNIVPKFITDIEITQEIDSIFASDIYIGFVCENTEGEEAKVLLVYDLKGNEILRRKDSYEYRNIDIYGKDIILYNDTNATVITVDGKVRLETTFENSISYLFPTEKRREFILIDETNMNKIKLAEE